MNQDKKKKPLEGEIQAKKEPIESQPQAEQARQPTNEEGMMRRQSAPRPTMQQGMQQALQNKIAQGGMPMGGANPMGQGGGFSRPLKQPIGKEQVQKAILTLNKYKEGKANLERRIIDNEQWYKLRHWECMRDKSQDIQPTSAWLFNCIANKHADAMDNFPSPNILPREEGDKAEAEKLTSIIPVVLDQCEFEQAYSDIQNYKLKTGTGVYFIHWDKSKLNGLGDIGIKKADILNLFGSRALPTFRSQRTSSM